MFPLKDSIPTDRFPVVTVALILANVVAFFLSLRDGGDLWNGPSPTFLYDWGFIPYEASHLGDQCVVQGDQVGCGDVSGQPSLVVTAFSSMFLHGGLLHIGGNMLFLWVFGNNVEDSMGRVTFLAFYLLAGLAALVGQYLVGSGETVPLVGASGAVAGVLGGYLVLYPRARVVTLVFIILFVTILELPALFFLGFWFLQQIAFGYFDLVGSAGDAGGVAYFAHIGGFVFGALLVKVFATRVSGGADRGRRPVY
ncbi:rhomboid family intramembrane serine protease [Conexibacter sp. SYSU D00693]|uniref:rhomboid family intramembrane serine protease n=1 Tax=Conexibacter sp. SYSU D00693 TaxID=2812560 RepID=UPI00196B735A|nr:rhomboid family intramembrane serine protease [Conexibacter sp. SYSU D00693]